MAYAWGTFTEAQWGAFTEDGWGTFVFDLTGLVLVAIDAFAPMNIYGAYLAGVLSAAFVPKHKEDSFRAGANTTEAFVSGAKKVNKYGL